jgi:hypothetical protein
MMFGIWALTSIAAAAKLPADTQPLMNMSTLSESSIFL